MRRSIAVSILALWVWVGVMLATGVSCRRKEATPAKATTRATHTRPATTTGTAVANVVNVTCPIMGNKIDPAHVPDELTRQYKGQKVGFCCPVCPPQWDKLSDAEKDAKLAAALPPPTP